MWRTRWQYLCKAPCVSFNGSADPYGQQNDDSHQESKQGLSCNSNTHIVLHTLQLSRQKSRFPYEDRDKERQVKKWFIFQHLCLLLFNGVIFMLTLAHMPGPKH